MDYKKLQNGSDIRGVALEGIAGQTVNLTEDVCKNIGRGFALWLKEKTGNGKDRSRTMCLNGKELVLGANDELPAMDGVKVSGQLQLPAHACAFVLV